MRPGPAPLKNKARPPGSEGCAGQLPGDRDLREQLEERLRFERLLTDLSATFLNAAADSVDAQIEQALKQLVNFLGVERGGFGQLSEDRKAIFATHSFVVPGYPPLPPLILQEDLPWYAAQVQRGEVMRFERLPEDAPAEAVNELAYVIKTGMKSNLTIPLKAGGIVLGAISFGAFREFRAWPDELVQRLRIVGEIFANALARKRADQELHAREESLRKNQDELRLLTGRLLQAQEDQRRRIAREMHDDWTQRLAILAIDAAKLETQLDPSSHAHGQLQAMRAELVRLSEDVHALSRHLHPSILDDLGLVAALRLRVCQRYATGGCRGGLSLGRRHPLVAEGRGPVRLPGCPGSPAKCRQARRDQGSLRVARQVGPGTHPDHPGSRRWVRRKGARSREGLGLSSMAERVRLVRGKLAVDSEPGHGTTVTVRVPAVGNES